MTTVNGAKLYSHVIYTPNASHGLDPSTELYWVTASGTTLLTTISHASSVYAVESVNSHVTFAASVWVPGPLLNTGQTVTTLYSTDGTTRGTTALLTLPGVNTINEFQQLNARELFQATNWTHDQTGDHVSTALYATNGTSAGTSVLNVLPDVNGIGELSRVNSHLLYTATHWVWPQGYQMGSQMPLTTVYGTDGTPGGSQSLISLLGVNGVSSKLTVNQRDIFTATAVAANGVQTTSVYGSDGTALGTQEILHFDGGKGVTASPTAFFGDSTAFVFELLIASQSGGSVRYETEIFESDGTTAGTHLKWDLPGIYGVSALPAPLVTPGAAASVLTGSSVGIAGLGVLQINPGSQQVSATVTATHGTLSTSEMQGSISGAGTAKMTISGTIAQVDVDLASLKFTGTSAGTGTISVTASMGKLTSSAASSTVSVTAPAPPVLAHHTADQMWAIGQHVSFQFAANTFTDPQGAPLSYTASLANGAALPAWLSFNAATETFSGIVPAGTKAFDLKVVATDLSYKLSTTESFNVSVGAAAHQAQVPAAIFQSGGENDAFSYGAASSGSESSVPSSPDTDQSPDRQPLVSHDLPVAILAIDASGAVGHIHGSGDIIHSPLFDIGHHDAAI
ncbi:MAG TPA: putative Ig domain-containing protein [Rhizomicrobium sp.]